ncbi:hypothetical protein BST81_22820 [Leptolyngbya sp. 'hensonii']|uniref:DUF4079 domain-containing protein n=1 Tax=Leptolyngbya sp. 'hensonii' TaxID=1922337 RepID=UPI0009500964|nr:DUF4079 domain-containing protein [Leptolyngbya sp. 'hensonii']OLP16064.1 hypothetical protein BST81_22820 [Leptolyngbya sp. 'hensonii']
MDLPSFLWLWKIAAWSMGFSILAYLILAGSGTVLLFARMTDRQRPDWLRPFHYWTGGVMVGLVLLLLAIGIVGTIGHYGTLGHSFHLLAGTIVVGLVLASVWSAAQISIGASWARSLHRGINLCLFVGFAWVSWTGWVVVQKYLP